VGSRCKTTTSRTAGGHRWPCPKAVLSGLLEAFRAGEGVGQIRKSVCAAFHELIEVEAPEPIGAAPCERSTSRVTERNGAVLGWDRARVLSTKAGDVNLGRSCAWDRSSRPSSAPPCVDQALIGVVMEAHVHDVSTRAVDNPLEALRVDAGVSKSEVSRICPGIDAEVNPFRTRSLDHIELPTSTSTRLTATSATPPSKLSRWRSSSRPGQPRTGRSREVLGLDVGYDEDETYWRGFLTSLKI